MMGTLKRKLQESGYFERVGNEPTEKPNILTVRMDG